MGITRPVLADERRRRAEHNKHDQEHKGGPCDHPGRPINNAATIFHLVTLF